jgi:MFS family permease
MKNLRLWIFFCAIGEFLGIGFAAAVAVAWNVFSGDQSSMPWLLSGLIVMMFAGWVEGMCLSFFQGLYLKKNLPGLDIRKWRRNTVFIAVSGWFLGSLPSLFISASQPQASSAGPPLWIMVLLVILMGIVLGGLFGFAQYLVLKTHFKHPRFWISAHMSGWILGLGFIFLAATVPDEHTDLWKIVLGGLFSGMLAGISVGCFGALAFRKMEKVDTF